MSHHPDMGSVHTPSGPPRSKLHLQEKRLALGVSAALCSGAESYGERLVLPEDKFHGQRGAFRTRAVDQIGPASWPVSPKKTTPAPIALEAHAPFFALKIGHYLCRFQ